MALNCIVSGGCIISGASLRRSLLFSNVQARSYSDIEDSVIMPDVVVNRHCKIRRAIIDTGTVLPEGTEIGMDPDVDRERGFRVTANGITLATPDNFGQMLHRIR
jgi:glucose-1-phosphate adenylyltransferase